MNDFSVLYDFENIAIPFIVLEELDELKESSNEKRRYQARTAIRGIDEFLKTKEIKFIPKNGSAKNNDDAILNSVFLFKESNTQVEITIVTNDINLKIKSIAANLKSISWSKEKEESIETKPIEIELSDEQIDFLYRNRYIDFYPLKPNQTIIATSKEKNQSALCVYQNNTIKLIQNFNKHFYKKCNDLFAKRPNWFVPRSKEQQFAQHFLFDKDVPMLTMTGKAGVGKTGLSISAGLYQTVVEEKYKKIIITRSLQPMGKEIGFIPGDKNSKLSPWLASFKDNLEYILGDKHEFENLVEDGVLELEAPTFIRGRSLRDCFVVIDESQNMDLHEIKTILTRIGENSKIVFLGDVEQIDGKHLNKENNGLSQLIQKMSGQPLVSHIHLTKGERSSLATIASELL